MEPETEEAMAIVIQRFIHFVLLNPDLELFTVDSLSGEKMNIDRGYLRSRRAVEDFHRGFIHYELGYPVSKTEGKYIFVNRIHFENFLAGEPIVELSGSTDDAVIGLSYIPPYIEFMLRAVTALDLSAEKRTHISKIVYWLNENWPDNLGKKSDHLVASMATILRRPQDKSGGSTPWKDSS
ncbi:MAG: hypothetical protein V7727_17055 [Sneathiella sp.]